MCGNEESHKVLRRALYVVQDNMKPGNEQYNVDRVLLESLIQRHQDVINKLRDQELAEIRLLEKIEREIVDNLRMMNEAL